MVIVVSLGLNGTEGGNWVGKLEVDSSRSASSGIGGVGSSDPAETEDGELPDLFRMGRLWSSNLSRSRSESDSSCMLIFSLSPDIDFLEKEIRRGE
jgi:hypothetical protein